MLTKLALATLLLASTALADDGVNSGDTAFVLISAALVFFMVIGLALFYGGLVGKTSVLNTILMSVFSIAVVSIVWLVIGYSLAFSGGNSFIGFGGFAGLDHVFFTPEAPYAGTVPHYAFMIFQCMFAGITSAIISGGVVERVTMNAYILFTITWTILVYCIVAHWVWSVWEDDQAENGLSFGWIRALGALDFAGGTVVHIISGVSALVFAAMLGPRADLETRVRKPHNIPMVVTGAGILWFGWFGFNAGSALTAGELASLAFANTHMCAAMSTITWAALEKLNGRKPTAVGAATGAVVGLVVITPAAGFVRIWATIPMGICGAVICFFALKSREHFRKYFPDDSLDAFCCHGLGGTIGALLTGLFATTEVNAAGFDGAFYGNGVQFGYQLAAVLASAAWAAALTAIIVGAMKLVMPKEMRVPAEAENEGGKGIDNELHNEEAYWPNELDMVVNRNAKFSVVT